MNNRGLYARGEDDTDIISPSGASNDKSNMSKTCALYHIVFSTKSRRMTLPAEFKDDLYRFIWKQTTEMKCRLLRVGGVANHVHMLIDLNPTISLAEYMRNIKGVSSTWMRRDTRFHDFEGWADGYYAGTIAYNDRDGVIEYIKSQETHHYGNTFDDELTLLHNCIGLSMHEQDMK